MNSTRLPRFTAESSVYRSKAAYLAQGSYGGQAFGARVAPQSRQCGQCSGFILGERLCCDVIRNCEPGGGCTSEAVNCTRTQCSGLLEWLVNAFGTIF